MPSMQPAQIDSALQLLGQGHAQTVVANAVGVDKSTICRLAKKHQEQIKAATLQMIQDNLPVICSNHRNTLQLANKLLSIQDTDSQALQNLMCKLSTIGIDPKDILDLSDRKEHRMMQMMGMVPTHTPSLVINNLFQTQTTVINQQVLSMVQREVARTLDVVDVPDLGLDSQAEQYQPPTCSGTDDEP